MKAKTWVIIRNPIGGNKVIDQHEVHGKFGQVLGFPSSPAEARVMVLRELNDMPPAMHAKKWNEIVLEIPTTCLIDIEKLTFGSLLVSLFITILANMLFSPFVSISISIGLFLVLLGVISLNKDLWKGICQYWRLKIYGPTK